MYDLAVFIGRFQPFHNGHLAVVEEGFKRAKNVLVLVGSANSHIDVRNPFTYKQRAEMILESVALSPRCNLPNLFIAPLDDMMYQDEKWIASVQDTVNKAAFEIINKDNPNVGVRGIRDVKIALIGHSKDNTSYYLKLFPTFDSISVANVDGINATDIRNDYLSYNCRINGSLVPKPVAEFMRSFVKNDTFKTILTAKTWHDNYKRTVTKYPRIEHTVDAVVVQSGHILLIRRRSEPGKGMWALPGGFIHPDERLVDAMLRELREETKLKVPEPVLRGCIVENKTYDDPNRSMRGRLITQAYLISLPPQKELPKVKGSDDADKAQWVPISELKVGDLFEDHYWIIQDMLGRF